MKPAKAIPVLITDLIKINQVGNQYQVFIALSQGGVIEHEPFPANVQGLVAALDLATQICAGKFFPKRVVTPSGPKPEIPDTLLLNSFNDSRSLK